MNIEKRIQKLEAKAAPETKSGRHHMVFVNSGQTEEEQIEKFKAENDVGPDDDFFVIEFVEPDPRRFERGTV